MATIRTEKEIRERIELCREESNDETRSDGQRFLATGWYIALQWMLNESEGEHLE